MRGAGTDGARAACGLPAQGLAMGVIFGLLGRIAEQHVIDEAQQTVEALWG
jgi:hypothetical protein